MAKRCLVLNTSCIFLPPDVLKINCEPRNDLEPIETFRSVNCIEFSCVWTNVDVFISLLITQQGDTPYNMWDL
jgi:hypothetical protein